MIVTTSLSVVCTNQVDVTPIPTNSCSLRSAGGAYQPPSLHSRASVDNAYLDAAGMPAGTPAGGSPSAAATPGAADASTPAPGLSQPAADSDGFSQPECRSVWLQAAHYATLRGFVRQHLLQRLLAAVVVLEWPLTIARRLSIPLLEQVCFTSAVMKCMLSRHIPTHGWRTTLASHNKTNPHCAMPPTRIHFCMRQGCAA